MFVVPLSVISSWIYQWQNLRSKGTGLVIGCFSLKAIPTNTNSVSPPEFSFYLGWISYFGPVFTFSNVCFFWMGGQINHFLARVFNVVFVSSSRQLCWHRHFFFVKFACSVFRYFQISSRVISLSKMSRNVFSLSEKSAFTSWPFGFPDYL